MKKLNSVVYNKLLLQAEEARDQGMEKLASNIVNAVGALHNEENTTYSYSELEEDIQQDLWKAATNILRYYDVDSVNVEKIDECIKLASKIFLESVTEHGIGIDSSKFGPLEPKVPGEFK